MKPPPGLPTDRPTEINAYFVGGPDHGVIRHLSRDVTDWRVIDQRSVRAMSTLANSQPYIPLSGIKYHEYRRTKEMSYPYMRDCFIFEWMGER